MRAVVVDAGVDVPVGGAGGVSGLEKVSLEGGSGLYGGCLVLLDMFPRKKMMRLDLLSLGRREQLPGVPGIGRESRFCMTL